MVIINRSCANDTLSVCLTCPLSLFCISTFCVSFMFQVKVGESLYPEASAPSKKAARQLAAEEAVKALLAEGQLQLNKVQRAMSDSSLYGKSMSWMRVRRTVLV